MDQDENKILFQEVIFLYRKGKLILKLNNNIFVMFRAPRQRFPYCKMQTYCSITEK